MMKSSVFLTDDLSAADLAAIETMATTADSSFANLVKIGGFDPKVDFRYGNFRGMDLGDADLRGFDFTGADLREVSGECTIDSTTILDSALLDGASFLTPPLAQKGLDIEIYEALRGSYWTDQIIVLERELKRQDLPASSKLATASALYALGKDSFIRRTAMRAMSKMMTAGQFLQFVRDELKKGSHSPIEVLSSALHIVDELYEAAPSDCLRFLMQLLDGGEAFETIAAAAIARNIRTQDIPRMAAVIKRRSSAVMRKSFIAALAARLSPVHAMMVRNPITNDTFDFDTRLSDDEFKSVTRAVTRRVRSESLDRSGAPKPFCEILGYPSKEAVVAIRLMEFYEGLALTGISVSVP
ncbi:pentapeptide repeat-containing protein [Rhizobium ruizarguesonis]|uniref:Pentapeptide repeat-containing protein n=2 Tax=Rhizobium/Agrobacterium group TaxID=227290 RepID=Q1MHY2_RHIJ3|nr:pentapeptide repeat-containing protein [Rhizobium leguminosarum bv. viciae USDA 2370]TBB11169.1 pentapeptide repeat-containing protein [Rhizobium ruizarguesonis]CAK07428.1 hypothetical protein with pentapeptide motif [Rhizobium johnstonii 3841]